jgi:arginyl-tRNA synthetase
VAAFPEAVDAAASSMEPSVVAAYLHDLAAAFSTWYRDNPVLANPDANLAASRLELVKGGQAQLRGSLRPDLRAFPGGM